MRLSRLEDLQVGSKLAKIEHQINKVVTKEEFKNQLDHTKRALVEVVDEKLTETVSKSFLEENIDRLYNHLGIVQEKDITTPKTSYTVYCGKEIHKGKENRTGLMETEARAMSEAASAMEDVDAELEALGISPLKSPSIDSIAVSTPIESLTQLLPNVTPPLKSKSKSVAGTPAVKRLDFTLTPRAASEVGDQDYQFSSDEDDGASTVILHRYGAGESGVSLFVH